VLIHDAARCFLPRELVTELIDTIRNHYVGVAPAVAVTDTIRLTDERGDTITQTLPRRRLVAMQTPQGADFDIMLKAALVAKEEGALVTDDLELLTRIGYPVRLVQGDDRNLKITTPRDLIIAEAMVSDEMNM
jgi:2-C-methyl-D-erythritol 4-phosphate cytidylyltransferase